MNTPEPAPSVLVIDDDPTTLAIVAAVLRPEFEVTTARDGTAALQAATRGSKPALILLDVLMPNPDGYELLSIIRNHPALREIPVVFVTALCDDIDAAIGLQLGAVDYVGKPIRPSTLLQCVRKHVRAKRR